MIYCVLCNRTFLNTILASGNSQHNFETHPSESKDKEMEYFKCGHDKVWKGQPLFVTAFQTRIEKATKASYRVSFPVTLDGEASPVD